MKTDITQDQIDFYQENGYILIEDFLSPDELEAWRKAVMAAVQGRGDNVIPGLEKDEAAQAQSSEAADYYATVFVQRVNLWYDNPAFRPFMIDERIGKMAAELAQIDGIRIWHDQALMKSPWASPTSWHKDNPYWSFHSPNAISIWIALDDATYENGCLYAIPGSHKDGRYENADIGRDMSAIFDAYPEYKQSPTVALPMKAGSCSLHNGLTIHGAGANMTPGWRRAITCAYMPDGATFNGQTNILTKKQAQALNEGDPLDDDRQNPLIYSKSKEYVRLDDQNNLILGDKTLTITPEREAYRSPR